MTKRRNKQRLALVLWKGVVGGAEVLTVALADRLRQLDVEATTVFLEHSEPLDARLSELGLPYRSLGLARGRHILRSPRRYAAEISRAGPDGAILVTCGFMGGTLRAGGYRGPIVAVEHGDLLEAESQPQRHRAMDWMSRVTGAWADNIEVAVSDFVLEKLRQQPHSHVLTRIYNGIDPSQFSAPAAGRTEQEDGQCVVAFASRLVGGKGPDYLIKAVAQVSSLHPIKLVIAGEGPERSRLESIAESLGIGDRVSFLGLQHDMPRFWQMCDIAAVPSAEFIEACPLTPLEAMACGKPVIATCNGGLPEIVIDGETGILVPTRDAPALVDALDTYAASPELRLRHGSYGRHRVTERFHIATCAQAYLDLFDAQNPQ